MICSIIYELFFKTKKKKKSAYNMWARKETTKNRWFAWRRNQVKVSLFPIYKAKKNIFTEKEIFMEKRELTIE